MSKKTHNSEDNKSKHLIFCLMGPTATGKTDIACELVQHFPFEIISIDSAMIYREMNIGTAKPDPEVLNKCPHYLIDIIDPIQSYSVANCINDVTNIAKDIFQRGKFPLLVGGTMMYFNAIQNGIANLPSASQSLREEILSDASKYGWEKMHAKLAELDPITAERINPNDKSRIQRALEVYEITKQSISDLILTNDTCKPEFDFCNILLMPEDRAWLHKRIAKRFTDMLNCGLVAELECLLEKWSLHKDLPAMRCVGYRQVLEYLQGEIDYSTMQDKGVAATRQLAKRQLTWLRKWPESYSFFAEEHGNLSAIMALLRKILDNH